MIACKSFKMQKPDEKLHHVNTPVTNNLSKTRDVEKISQRKA
jgi:hypothetical protein